MTQRLLDTVAFAASGVAFLVAVAYLYAAERLGTQLVSGTVAAL